MSSSSPKSTSVLALRRSAGLNREALLAYLFLLPSAVVIFTFGLLPLGNALLLSLRDWRNVPGPWIGLENYQRALFQEAEFWQSLTVTLWYVIGTVPTTLCLAYLLAELLHTRLRGVAVYRALFFMPYVVSPVAAAAVWQWIFQPDLGAAGWLFSWLDPAPRWLQEQAGFFTMLGRWGGFSVPEWAPGPSLALVCIIVVSIWQSLGFAVVVLLAGLAAVPQELLEAARLDGARGWRLARSVKLPLISPTFFFLLVVFTIRAFQTFTQIYVLSVDNNGGPAGSTRNITLYIYQCFNVNTPRLGPGYGSAVAMLLFGMILALTLLQFRVLGKRVHYS